MSASKQYHWYQFSLRTALATLTVSALVFGLVAMWSSAAERQRICVQRIREVGGVVCYTEAPPEESSMIQECRKWLPQDYFDDVDSVDLSGYNPDLRNLRDLRRLHRLYLDFSDVSDSDMVQLTKHKELQRLTLNHTRITDEGLRNLCGLTQLRQLYLIDTKVTPVGLANFQKAIPQCELHR